MSVVKKYNGLNGRTVSRNHIEVLLQLAKEKQQSQVIEKLQTLLDIHKSQKHFAITIQNPLTEAKAEKSFGDFETVPSEILSCLECLEIEDGKGLSKPVSPKEVYDLITKRMLEMIHEANLPRYKQKWKVKTYGTGYTIPFNFVSKKRYRGVNVLLLTNFKPLKNPFFLTFKQVNDLGGTIKKGSKGKEVIYFTKLWTVEDKKRKLRLSSYDRKKVEDFKVEHNITTDLNSIPILKYYIVHNGDDVEGIDFDLENFKTGYIEAEKPADENNRLEIPEAIIRNYPKPAPVLQFGGDSAYFRGGGVGTIQMPYLADFDTVQDYYRTLFHEYSHSTGTPQRLNRNMSGKFGSKPYAFEELVAELGATFLSAEAGIIWHNNSNHAAYLKSWNSALTHINEDNKFIMRASTLAQELTDYVLQFDKKGNPKYFTDLKKITKTVKPKPKPIPKPKPKPKRTIRKTGKLTGRTDTGISDLTKLGFVPASEAKREQPQNVFVLPGQIGAFLQKQQPYKSLILIKGDKHSSKSQLAMQIANAFGEQQKPVAYIDYEQGGVQSKDTIDSLNRNTTEAGRKYIAIIGHLDSPFQQLQEFCKVVKIIIADSVTDLKITADQLNYLRTTYPEVIWCFISQVKENGAMYGGNKMAHNPTCVIHCNTHPDPKERFAILEKNRGNDLTLKYSIYYKKLVAPQKVNQENQVNNN